MGWGVRDECVCMVRERVCTGFGLVWNGSKGWREMKLFRIQFTRYKRIQSSHEYGSNLNHSYSTSLLTYLLGVLVYRVLVTPSLCLVWGEGEFGSIRN